MSTMVNYVKAVAASAWMHSLGARGDLRKLKEKTAMVLPDVLPSASCQEMIARIDTAADESAHPRVWRDDVVSDTRVLGFEQDIPDLLPQLAVERRIAAADAYTGRKTKAWFLMANRVVPRRNNLGSGGGLHRDSPFSHQVKYIWYLSDVTTENGPFQFIPDTHFNLLKTRAEYPLGQTRFDRVAHDMVEVTAKAGSLLICDTKCIHRGKPIQAGARYAVTLYTLPTEDGARNLLHGSGIDPELVVQPRPS
ncbi:phytanoyl-CoA dioxygenase family protein [Altererythrobacter litoralis]|uniref:Phytanoyl-CoA dioxygenase family protein n=1 Tax=Altererythrobacter litoralis TaxID=3113904 RepID=A0ABU7GEZ8_9SPHN|nr:phytanoyl-CoA dioxygenase family protein [Erythrobacteraceae bacterium 1XM1-14]